MTIDLDAVISFGFHCPQDGSSFVAKKKVYYFKANHCHRDTIYFLSDWAELNSKSFFLEFILL
jgi:hypothetical protein